MKPKLVELNDGVWEVSHPKCVDENYSEFYDAVELMDYKPASAERKLRTIIKKCKNLHIDAILHLGFLLSANGKELEGNALINKAHLIALDSIPKGFDEKNAEIHWGFLDNRPFLRTFQAVGLEMMKEGDYEKASEKFKFGLNVNPNDNQGLRYLLLECYFHLSDPANALKLIKLHEDVSIDFVYGSVLANYQIGNLKKAEKSLKSAILSFPLGVKEIIKRIHKEPRNNAFGLGIVRGSEYEAYDYWMRTKQFWTETKGIIDFIRGKTT